LRRIINGGYHPRLCSIVSSRLLVSPIPYIIAQMLVHKRKETLSVHFYRTPIIKNDKMLHLLQFFRPFSMPFQQKGVLLQPDNKRDISFFINQNT
ncbi:MAG: hypothetical protein IJS63_11470, partial [Bacteroidaceae bacterium]|nr:hypothetical protein [Bacteroidaceae bacterium]